MKDETNGNEFNELFNDLKLNEPLKKIEVSAKKFLILQLLSRAKF